MNYTNDKEQIVFLKDADIARTIDGSTISGDQIAVNGVPAFDLFKERYVELSTYDSNLCTEISNLREETDQLSTDICLSADYISSSVDYLSDVVENTISADLYELSAGTYETSSFLSGQVKALWDDVRGGINYKGHLKSYRDAEDRVVNLSDIYLHSFAEYSPETKLNNGWLYCFTTEEPSKKYTTKDGIELDDRDYIVIHTHSDLSAIPVKDICRDTVDIIDTADDDYVRLNLLEQVSSTLSIDYVARVADLSDSLSTAVSNDIAYLSGQHGWLSDEISTVMDLSVKNLQDQVAGNDNDIEFLSSEAMRLSTELSNEIDNLSSSLCGVVALSVENLQEQITSNDADITNIQSYISGDNSLCTELSAVKYHYNKTFIEDEYEIGPDNKVDVLKIVNSQNTSDAYKLIYLSGTLVLESLPTK